MTETKHASCLAIDGRGLLITGASGRGKSGLALQLMALGAGLVADDRVLLVQRKTVLMAQAPSSIAGLIEARGIGLLQAPACGPVALTCVVDLSRVETDRMPPLRTIDLMGIALPLLYQVQAPHFPAALMLLMKEGRRPET